MGFSSRKRRILGAAETDGKGSVTEPEYNTLTETEQKTRALDILLGAAQ